LSIYRSSAGNLITYFDDEYDVSNTSIRFRMRTSGTPIDALTIASSGNVGIGTTSPAGLLHVKSSGAYGSVLVDNTGTTGGGYFASLQNGSTKGIIAVTGAIEGNTTSDFGIFAETGGALRFYVNGSATRSMSLTSGGNLLVGTTTDAGFRLDVNGTGRFSGNTTGAIATFINTNTAGTGNGLLVDVNSQLGTDNYVMNLITNGTSRMYVREDGNVGIGTSSPTEFLHLNNTSAASAFIRFQNTGGSGVYLGARNNDMELYSNGSERMRIFSNGNIGIGTVTDAGFKLDVNGTGRFSGQLTGNSWFNVANTFGLTIRNAANTAFRTAVQMNSSNVLIFGQDSDITALTFGVGSEAMRITSSGNVGIGTTSPGYRLVVNSATDGISAGISGNTFGIRFDNGGTFSSGMSTIHGVDNTLVGSYQPIMLNGLDVRFGTSANERMRITSGGDVLIGTTSNVSSGRRELVMRGGNGSVLSLGNNTTADRFQIASDSGENALINNKANTPMIFYTNNTERIRITSGGDVGIGTASPGARLTILTPISDSTVGFNLRAYATGADGDRTVISRYTSSNDNNWANSVYRAWAHIYETNGSERMRITSGGNVLIGTTTDVGARLHVNGTIRTGAPSGGSAVDWRLGTARGGTITPNAIVRVEIGGVLVDLDARYV
jgi:hypothetical protein